MKFSQKKLPGSEVELEIALTAEEFAPYWNAAEEEAIAKVSLKGFRTGAAPLELARKAIDPDLVLERSVTAAIRDGLEGASEEHGWKILGQPKVEVLEASPKMPGVAGGMKCKAKFAVFPEVKLPDYRAIAKKVIEKEKKNEVKVSGEEIEKSIEWIRQSRAKVTRVSRPAAKGDLLEVDIESSVGGSPIEGGKLDADRFVLGDSRFVPGFDDRLVGVSEGKTETFSLHVPDDYWTKELQGKDIDFKVTVKGVFDRELPPLDDEFAKSLGPTFETIAMLRANIEQGLMVERTEKERERRRAKVLEAIVGDTEADPPAVMVDRTLDVMVAETKELAGGRAGALKDEDIRKELAPKAKERVLSNLAVHEILKGEELEPTEEEVQAEAKALHLDPGTHYDYAYGVVRHRKFFEFLEGNTQTKN